MDMINHPLKRAQMGQDARKFVEDNFDRELIQQKVLDFYNTLGSTGNADAEYQKA